MKSTLVALVALASIGVAAEQVAQPTAKKGELIFSDDFDRAELGPKWRAVVPTFTVADGVLKGSQTRADHGAVGSVKAPLKDGVVEFKFQLAGATGINAVFDDKAWKESHAGHICRVALTPKQIRLGDDKEGVMRNDIMEMRKDPAKKEEVAKLLAGRGAAFPAKLETGTWYRARIEIAGEEIRVCIDDKLIGSLKSPGIGHPTKSDFHFTVSGKDALFDDVRIYAATAK